MRVREFDLACFRRRQLRDPLLIDTIADLQQRGVGFRSVQESIDTTTPGGKLIFHIFGALAEFERDLIRERTVAGLAAARARGANWRATAEHDRVQGHRRPSDVRVAGLLGRGHCADSRRQSSVHLSPPPSSGSKVRRRRRSYRSIEVIGRSYRTALLPRADAGQRVLTYPFRCATQAALLAASPTTRRTNPPPFARPPGDDRTSSVGNCAGASATARFA